MQAVILVGGLGTRLRPITYKIPKSMVDINGRPFLYYQIVLLKRYGIKDILLCIGYLGEQIRVYFGNGENFGVNISYSVEKTPLGTGGALKNAERLLNDAFIIMYGDTYLEINYREFIDFFSQSKTMGAIVVSRTKNKSISNIKLDKDDFVVDYQKNKMMDFDYIDAGTQIFKKDIVDLIPKNRKVSLEEEIFPLLIHKKQLKAFITKKRFYDMGTARRLQKIKELLK